MSAVPPKIGVGFPHMTLLDTWGFSLYRAFDHMPYLVGSSIRGKEWRDVDVRIMLPDEEWVRLFGETIDRYPRRMIGPWAVICTAISVWGREWTRLPIDFQFQTMAEGNKEGGAVDRVPIGMGYYER